MAVTAPSRANAQLRNPKVASKAVRALALTYARNAVIREHRLRGASDEYLAASAKLIETNAKLRVRGSLLALARINLARESKAAAMLCKEPVQ